MPKRDRSSIVAGAIWMVVVSLVLFFLPIVNGIAGGAVGGYKVGSPGRAIAAAVLPAAVVAVGLWVLLALLQLPIAGLVAGVALGMWILLSSLGVLAGALAGGAIASATSSRRAHAQ